MWSNSSLSFSVSLTNEKSVVFLDFGKNTLEGNISSKSMRSLHNLSDLLTVNYMEIGAN